MPAKGPGLAVLVVVVLLGGAVWLANDDDRLDIETETEVVRNWGRIVETCSNPERQPSPAQVAVATRSLGVLITQYGRTPDDKVQLVESSDTDTMRRTLELVAREDPKDAAACEPIRQGARAALRYGP